MASLNYKYGFLPFIPTVGAPPANSGYSVGLTLAQASMEFWRSKTVGFSWNWHYVPNIFPTESLTWSASGTIASLRQSWYADTTTPVPMSQRVCGGSYGYPGWVTNAVFNGTTSGGESDQVRAIFGVDWSQMYWDRNGTGLYYPLLGISVGGVDSNAVTNTGSNATALTCAWDIGGASLNIPMFDDTSGVEGGTKTGSIVIASTDYWPAS